MSPEDTKFANYMLREMRADSQRVEGKLDGVTNALHTLAAQVTTLTADNAAHQREDGRRFDALDRRIDKLDKDVEDTGEHAVADLKAHLAEARAELKAKEASEDADAKGRASDAAKERRALRNQIIGGILLLLAGAAVSQGVSRATSPRPASAATK